MWLGRQKNELRYISLGKKDEMHKNELFFVVKLPSQTNFSLLYLYKTLDFFLRIV